MAIKLTYRELSTIGHAIQKLMAVGKADATHIERARIARFVKPLLTELGEYEKLRNELIAKLGEPVKDGVPGQFRIKTENLTAYADEMKKLIAIDVELLVSPLPESLHKLANLTVEDMNNLGDLIVWPKDEDEPPPAAALASVPPAK
jgi:hypothetical protein